MTGRSIPDNSHKIIEDMAKIVNCNTKRVSLAPSWPYITRQFTIGGENMEVWRDVLGYEGLYQVSDAGRVRSLDRLNSLGRKVRGSVRKQTKNKNGYLYVNLCKNGVSHNCSVHRLVAKAFLPNPNNLYTVNHKNENKEDNRIQNLEWLTLQDNLQYGTHNERMQKNRKGKACGADHPNYGKRGANANTHKGRVIGINKDDPDNIIEFDTAADASRHLHISSGQLCEAIQNKNRTCGGYYWRRVNG